MFGYPHAALISPSVCVSLLDSIICAFSIRVRVRKVEKCCPVFSWNSRQKYAGVSPSERLKFACEYGSEQSARIESITFSIGLAFPGCGHARRHGCKAFSHASSA